MSKIPRLHDATLQNIHFDWPAGVISLHLQVGPAASDFGVLRAEGVTSFKCPRLMPWGPSDSVNNAHMETVSDGELLAVEMQSGDLIEIHCGDAQYLAALDQLGP